MNVEKGKVVSIHYTLKDPEGQVLDSSQGGDPLAYLHGSNNIIPGLESALDGKETGENLTVVVEPENGYGARHESQVATVPRSNLQGIDNLQVGMQLQAQTPEGPRVVQVVGLNDDSVTIDANHPLAGVTLHFDVTVADVRDATTEEVSHGHAHGAGGHTH